MIVDHYLYLVANLFALPMLLVFFFVAGPQRRAMAASGVVFMAWSVGAPLFDAYWSPARIGGLPVGIEDLLYCFQSGAGVWFWGSLADRRRLIVELRLRSVATNTVMIAIPIAAGFAVLGAAGLDAITQSIIVLSVVVAVLLARAPWFWRVALAASVGCTANYILFLWALFAIWPDAAALWPATGLWTVRALGIPIGEIPIAVIGPPAHALIFAFVARARFVTPARTDESTLPTGLSE